MANKRDLKKNIKNICGEIAAEAIFACYAYENIDVAKMNDMVIALADLQQDSIVKVSVSYDKNIKSFNGDKKAYQKAKSQYYQSCFKTLISQFNDTLKQVLAEMNTIRKEAV